MTFLLDERDDLPTIKVDNSNVDIPGFFGAVGNAASRAALETNSNFRLQRERDWVRTELADKVADRVNLEDAISQAGDRFDHLNEAPTSYEEALTQYGSEAVGWYLQAAREQAKADPAAWADVDLSDDGIEATINERLKTEYDDLSAAAKLVPQGAGMAELLGGIVGVTADIRNVPFLLMGGGSGSLFRVATREAFINAGAEALFLGSQFEMADRLGIEDPNVGETLALAAAGGAVLGAGVEGIGRGINWYRQRNAVPPILTDTGLDDVTATSILDEFEDIAQTTTETPFTDMSQRWDTLVLENPLNIPRNEDEVPWARQTEADMRDGGSEDQIEARIAEQEAYAADEWSRIVTEYPEMDWAYPLTQTIIKRGGIARFVERDGERVLSPVAQELEARGVTSKTYPGLWRKDGHTDLDNLVADEIPGLGEVLPVDRQTGYFEPQGLIDAIANELTAKVRTPMNGDIAARMARIDEGPDLRIDERPVATEAQIVDDLTIDPRAFSTPEQIDEAVNNYLAQNGDLEYLSSERHAELLRNMREVGGSVDDALDRVVDDIIENQTRSAQSQEARDGQGNTPGGNDGTGSRPVAETGPAASRPGQLAGEPTGGSQRNAPVAEPAFETTGAGEQSVIAGVDPITQRQRLEADQARQIDGGTAATDFGLFDMNARNQGDMFDDVTSSEARAVQDQLMADLREEMAEFQGYDLMIRGENGERAFSEIVNETLEGIEAAETFADLLQLCGRTE